MSRDFLDKLTKRDLDLILEMSAEVYRKEVQQVLDDLAADGSRGEDPFMISSCFTCQ